MRKIIEKIQKWYWSKFKEGNFKFHISVCDLPKEEISIRNAHRNAHRAIKNSLMWRQFFLEGKNKKTIILSTDYVVLSQPYWKEVCSKLNDTDIKIVSIDEINNLKK